MKEKFFEYLKSLGYQDRINEVNKLLKKVSKITKDDEDKVLESSDFSYNDKKVARLEALIGELRVVVFLDRFNFVNIKLLKASQSGRRSDINAELSQEPFFIEVTCLTKFYSRKSYNGIYVLDNDKFKRELKGKILNKKEQLDGKEGKYKKMIVFVLNKYPELALYQKEEYLKIVESCY